jgi:WD40 repeat protein
LRGHSKAVEGVAFSPDDKHFASAGADGHLKLWTVEGDSVGDWEVPDIKLKSVCFSPDGRYVVTGGADGVLRAWNPAKREPALIWPAHKNTIYGVTFSSDGKLFASAGYDRTIHVWKVIHD